jgi:Putative prokaryotic signal transducing protein
MIEILKTGDPVRLNFLTAVLEEADLHPFVVGPGPYPGVLLSRVMVPDSEAELARRLIVEAERDLG